MPHLKKNLSPQFTLDPHETQNSAIFSEWWSEAMAGNVRRWSIHDCGRTHGTWQFFLRFSKYFSGFHVDFWIANYFLIREKFICGSNIFIRICNSFLDLTNFPTRICKKYCDLKFFFGFENYFWIVPFRLPYLYLESLKFFETPKILNSNVLRKAKL